MDFSRKNNVLCILLFALAACFLLNAGRTAEYAYIGLKTWFDNMIVSLFPFLVLTNFLFLSDLASQFITPAYLLLRPVLRNTKEAVFVVVFGFLCGFPLGGKCIVDFYTQGKLSKENAEYLLAFCNNLGPSYLLGFVLGSIMPDFPVWKALLLTYGIAFSYGLLLRYTIYRGVLNKEYKLSQVSAHYSRHKTSKISRKIFKNFNSASTKISHRIFKTGCVGSKASKTSSDSPNPLSYLPDAIQNALSQLTLLGGYMILFNALRLIPDLFLRSFPSLYLLCQSTIEISGGLLCIKVRIAESITRTCAVFSCLAFNGFCCHFQTFSLLRRTDLSAKKYMLHKIILCSITALITLVL